MYIAMIYKLKNNFKDEVLGIYTFKVNCIARMMKEVEDIINKDMELMVLTNNDKSIDIVKGNKTLYKLREIEVPINLSLDEKYLIAQNNIGVLSKFLEEKNIEFTEEDYSKLENELMIEIENSISTYTPYENDFDLDSYCRINNVPLERRRKVYNIFKKI